MLSHTEVRVFIACDSTGAFGRIACGSIAAAATGRMADVAGGTAVAAFVGGVSVTGAPVTFAIGEVFGHAVAAFGFTAAFALVLGGGLDIASGTVLSRRV